MVERRMKRYLLVMSFAIAVILFFSGLGLGMVFDKMRSSEINSLLTKSQLDMESFLLQQQFLSKELDSSTCALAQKRFVQLQSERAEIGQKLDSYESKALSQSELNNLKRKHIILSVSSLLVLENIKTDCGLANLDGIIFFYSKEDTPSTKQGLILDEVYNRFPESVTIFAFDADFTDEPLVDFLKARYNVTSTPAVIVNGKKKEGLVPLEDVIELL